MNLTAVLLAASRSQTDEAHAEERDGARLRAGRAGAAAARAAGAREGDDFLEAVAGVEAIRVASEPEVHDHVEVVGRHRPSEEARRNVEVDVALTRTLVGNAVVQVDRLILAAVEAVVQGVARGRD